MSVSKGVRESVLIGFKETNECGDNKDKLVDVCKWSNGDGFDVTFENDSEIQYNKLSCTWDEWKYLKKAVKLLLKKDEE